MKVYEIEDGSSHMIAASSLREAIALYFIHEGEAADDVDGFVVGQVTEDRARGTFVGDGDDKETVWAASQRDGPCVIGSKE